MSKTADQIVFPQPRTDGAALVGDQHTGMPVVTDDVVVPLRPPIDRPPTLGSSIQPAPIVGDQVSGMPQNDQPVMPIFPPIEKVKDSRTELPHREVEP